MKDIKTSDDNKLNNPIIPSEDSLNNVSVNMSDVQLKPTDSAFKKFSLLYVLPAVFIALVVAFGALVYYLMPSFKNPKNMGFNNSSNNSVAQATQSSDTSASAMPKSTETTQVTQITKDTTKLIVGGAENKAFGQVFRASRNGKVKTIKLKGQNLVGTYIYLKVYKAKDALGNGTSFYSSGFIGAKNINANGDIEVSFSMPLDFKLGKYYVITLEPSSDKTSLEIPFEAKDTNIYGALVEKVKENGLAVWKKASDFDLNFELIYEK